jgi:hypothetical protein
MHETSRAASQLSAANDALQQQQQQANAVAAAAVSVGATVAVAAGTSNKASIPPLTQQAPSPAATAAPASGVPPALLQAYSTALVASWERLARLTSSCLRLLHALLSKVPLMTGPAHAATAGSGAGAGSGGNGKGKGGGSGSGSNSSNSKGSGAASFRSGPSAGSGSGASAADREKDRTTMFLLEEDVSRCLHAFMTFGVAAEQQWKAALTAARASKAKAALASHAEGSSANAAPDWASVRSGGTGRGGSGASAAFGHMSVRGGGGGAGTCNMSSWYSDSDSGYESDGASVGGARFDDPLEVAFLEADDLRSRPKQLLVPPTPGSAAASLSAAQLPSSARSLRSQGALTKASAAVGTVAAAVAMGTRSTRRLSLRVRATALYCVRALANLSTKPLQSKWSLFVPEVLGTHPRPFSPTLITVLLYDSSSRVKEAAAAALGGLLADAPLSMWIALPMPAGTGSGAAKAAASRLAGSSSLSNKTIAMVSELHAGLAKALMLQSGLATTAVVPFPGFAAAGAAPGAATTVSSVPKPGSTGSDVRVKKPTLVAASLRAVAQLVGCTPYGRLPGDTLDQVFALVLALLQSDQQPVVTAAVQCVSVMLGCPAAVTTPAPRTVQHLCRPWDSSTATAPATGTKVMAAITALTLCGKTSNTQIRSDVLGVLARASKHHAALLASLWPQLCGVILEAFGDASAPVRGNALKLMEELLHARSSALSPICMGDRRSGEFGSGGGEEGADEEESGPATAAAEAELAIWRTFAIESVPAPTPTGRSVTLSTMFRLFFPRAMRDTSASVRAAAIMCISYLLPSDWSEMLHQVARTASAGAPKADGSAADAAANVVAVEEAMLVALVPHSKAISTRNEILHSVADAAADNVASVRVAVCRLFGSYISQSAWRTPTFVQLAARALLHLLADDSPAVRAKASWALGSLCTPVDGNNRVKPQHIASESLLPVGGSTRARPKLATGPVLASATGPLSLSALPHSTIAASSMATLEEPEPMVDTIFPLPNELPPTAVYVAPVAKSVHAQILDEEDILKAQTAADAMLKPPMELYVPGVSQSALVNLLSLSVLRVLTRSIIRASADLDKVASTAVRTLGFCVQALILHWLPLPIEYRHAVDPVVHVEVRDPSTIGPKDKDAAGLPTRRPDQKPCPDDELIKTAMLLLADIVGGKCQAAVSASDLGTSSGPSVAVGVDTEPRTTKPSSSASRPSSPPRIKRSGPDSPSFAAGEGPKGHATKLATEAWLDINEEDDVREIIRQRKEGPSMTRALKQRSGDSQAAAEPVAGGESLQARTRGQDDGDGGPTVKTRWNACHAVCIVIPLAHRVVTTHCEEWTSEDSKQSMRNRQTNASRELLAAASYNGISTSLVNSPPRPRVRKDASDGAVTMLAGVDHLSTALSPFVPKAALERPLRTGGSTPLAAGSTCASPVPSSPQRDHLVHQSALPDATAQEGVDASATGIAVKVVTDAVHPSVTIGATWVPPVLAALHNALVASSNFKVRIAATQALAMVPSRQAYRIPSPTLSASSRLLPSGAEFSGFRVTSALASVENAHYLSPALQQPGYDAFGPTLCTLVLALGRSEETAAFADYKYKDQLKGAIRLALLHAVLLAEKLDYGRMKTFMDDSAQMLYTWLCAEETLLIRTAMAQDSAAAMACLSPDTSEAEATAEAAEEPMQLQDESDHDEEEELANGPESPPAAPTSGSPFVNLQLQAGIDMASVKSAFRTLAVIFASRVKSIPKDLLRKYQRKAITTIIPH